MPVAVGRGRRRRLLVLVAALALPGAIGACNEPFGRPAETAGGAGSSQADAGPSVPPAPLGAASTGPEASAPASDGPATGSIPIDPSLLELLPASVDGLALEPVPDPEGADDPALADTVDRLAQAMLFDPPSGDFAVVSVMALRPGVFDAAYFRSWRESFDEGACSQSDGIAGHAQTAIGGRTVYLGRCTGGVSTYHVRLDSPNAIVSISESLDRRLAERILAGLRP
ncbi:MAG: hypothetical protein QOF11_1460 [Chloroflexota bacterium]|nr:hypothetical protein [Chloroflexota bacterium]